MKTLLAAFALTAMVLFGAKGAEAQYMPSVIPIPPAGESAWPSSVGPAYVGATYAGFSFVAPASGYLPYSYYAALPFPARGYVGYGNNDFPFYGRPYGAPSDPWTWTSMSRTYYATRGVYGYPAP